MPSISLGLLTKAFVYEMFKPHDYPKDSDPEERVPVTSCSSEAPLMTEKTTQDFKYIYLESDNMV